MRCGVQSYKRANSPVGRNLAEPRRRSGGMGNSEGQHALKCEEPRCVGGVLGLQGALGASVLYDADPNAALSLKPLLEFINVSNFTQVIDTKQKISVG